MHSTGRLSILLLACLACARRPPAAPPARVIVVGGGLAGLTTAYELQKRGITAHVLEATDTWGGRVATAHYDGGLHAEYGMQEVWAGTPVMTLAKELELPLIEPAEPALSSVVIDGQLHPFVQSTSAAYLDALFTPDERKAWTGWLGRVKSTRAALVQGVLRDDDPLETATFGAWVREQRLPHKVEEFVRLTLECEMATNWDTFSAASGILEAQAFVDDTPNYRIEGGNHRLIDALVTHLNGPKTLDAEVVAVEHTPTHARVSYLHHGQVESVEAERVVLAVPFFRVYTIAFTPKLSAEKWDGIRTLGRGGYTVVHLLVDEAEQKALVDGGSPFPILSDGITGVIYGVVDEAPRSPLQVFAVLMHGDAAKDFHTQPRDEELSELEKALDARWAGFSAHVHDGFVYSYHPAAVAVWPPGRSPVDRLAHAIRQPEQGLYLAGDWTVSAHAAGAVQSGLRVADEIARELASQH